MSSYDICLGCMSNKNGAAECPRCGYIEGTPAVKPALTPGTVLGDRYLIGRRLSANGEGITYIGMDQQRGVKVTVREFFPANMCERASDGSVLVRKDAQEIFDDYLSDFIEIAHATARMGDSASIAPVLDVFEMGGTAYSVHKYVQGTTLYEVVRRAKRLTWEEARPIFQPLISTMVSAHAIGLVHFGISPETILLNKEGKLVLTGFGVPDARLAETDLRPDMEDGFCAIEQYAIEGKKGKWTDVYAMSAVLLFALTGKRPPDAITRSREPRLNIPSELADSIPAHVITAIAGGLQVHAEDRISSMDALRSELFSRGAAYERYEEPQRAPQRSYETHEPGFAQRSIEWARRVTGRYSNNRGGNNSKNGQSGHWYENLSQFQYLVLSTCLGILIIGTVAVVAFLLLRSSGKLGNKKPAAPSVSYLNTVSKTDVTETEETVKVPELRGILFSEVSGMQDFVNFELYEKESKYSDSYDVGLIMEQSIAPNTDVAKGTPIAVTVSLGSEMCTVPNIVGMTVTEADDALTKAGLILGEQTEQYSDSIEQGKIIELVGTSVGSRMKRGSSVAIKISLGRDG